MINADEDLLFCDLAETYGLIGYRHLNVMDVARLAYGLRDDSRIKMFMSESKTDLKTLLLANAVDQLSFIAWSKTKDAEKNRNRPKSVVMMLQGKEDEEKPEHEVYDSPEAFIEARKKLLKVVNNG